MCVFMKTQFRIRQSEPTEITLNVVSFLNAHSEISKGRGLLVMIEKLCYGIAFTIKMNSDDKI